MRNHDNWFIVKNTYEPLVDEDVFETVQKHLAKNSHFRANTVNKRHLLQGLLYCKECGSKLGIQTSKKAKGEVRNIQRYTYSKYGRYGKCFSHLANYDDLENDILHYPQELGENFLKEYDPKAMSARYERINEDFTRLEKEKQDIEKKLTQEQKISKQLYPYKVEDI